MFYFCIILLNVGMYFNNLSLSALDRSANKKRRGKEGVVMSIATVKSYLWKPLLSTLVGPQYIKSSVLLSST